MLLLLISCRPISLKLRQNDNLVVPNFKTYIWDDRGSSKLLPQKREHCHYLHQDGTSVAAISVCEAGSMVRLLNVFNFTVVFINPYLIKIWKIIIVPPTSIKP